jgi:hypothetical protein
MRKVALFLLGFVVLLIVAAHMPGAPSSTSPASTNPKAAGNPPNKVPPAPKTGFWNITKKTNAVDDSVTTVIFEKTPELLTGSGTNEFAVRCRGGRAKEAYIAPWKTNGMTQLETEDYDSHTQRVRVRVDTDKPFTQSWSLSTDFSALYMPVSTLRKIEHAEGLTVEFQPTFEARATATMPIEGLDVALKQAGCKI